MPFNVVLYEPEIPPNTGAIMRLCANTGAALHLVHPLAFELDDTRLRRAGLDYREFAHVVEHESLGDCLAKMPAGSRCFGFSTRGQLRLAEAQFKRDDYLLFGPETRGLPQEILDGLPAAQTVRIPMRADSRSLNLANAVSVVVYEGWRQLGYEGAAN